MFSLNKKQKTTKNSFENFFCISFCFCYRYNRTKIRWSKNRKFLDKAKNVKISKKGALRILDVVYRDSGTYACHAGLSIAELKLKVKPKPGDRPPTEQDYNESIEEAENESKNDSFFMLCPLFIFFFPFSLLLIDSIEFFLYLFLAEDRSDAYKIEGKDLNGGR